MAEKTSQTNSSSNNLPSVPAVAPTSDTPYIQPIIGKLGYDTEHPDIFGIGASPDNGVSFRVFASFDGLVFNDNDIDAIWNNGTSEKVKSEVNSATAEIPAVKSNIDEALQRADEAIKQSTTNSEAIININSAVSAAKSDAQNATNIANAMKSSVTDQLKNLDSISKELDNARTEMTQYAKTAQDQGKDIADLKKSTAEITADVANTKGDVAELKINASATAVMASNNKSDITQLQVTASNASIDLQNAKSDIASFNATADKINTSIKDQDNRISTVEQTAKGIQATIGNQQNDINTIKQDATGMKETITNNQKQLTEINTSVDGLSTKVAGAVGKDFVESSIKQANDKINESITSINGNIQNITADLNGVQATVKNKADVSQITQLTNLISTKVNQDDYKSAITQLGDDINARVQKGDLMSQINIEAGRLLFQSNKIFLDADTIVFSENSKAFIPDAAIENLSLDKLTTGSLKIPLADDNGNAISLDESGITINSALSPVTWIPFYGKSDDQSGFYLSLSSKGMKFVNHFVYGKDTQKQIGAKSDDYTFMDIQPDVLHYRDGSTDNVNIPSGLTMYVPQETSSSLGPASPGGFFAMGYKNSGSALHGQDIKKGVEIAYVSKEINGWLEGFHVETNMFVHPRGADHGIRFAWVSWSAWDFGERYPAIVNDTANWGGVAFPKSGSVTLFNATGKYYTPDKDTGHGKYSDYQ